MVIERLRAWSCYDQSMMHTQDPFSLKTDTYIVNSPVATLYELPEFTVVQISGLDAVSFLQGQITNDIAGADLNVARLAGYCTAKGRLLATMVLGHLPTIEHEPPALFAVLRQDIVEPVLKRLRMFVMRAKVSFTDAPMSVLGVSTTPAQRAQLEQLLGHTLPARAWQTQHHATGIWIAAPGSAEIKNLPVSSGASLRWWWLSSPAQQSVNAAMRPAFAFGPSAQWQAQDIEAGLPWIEAATQDLFIPQTLNLDLIEGVSFTKGCYPGQEIVARSHYRGTVKRRMAGATLSLPTVQEDGMPTNTTTLAVPSEITQVLPGADMYDRMHADQPCGRIINVSTSGDQTYLLFEATFEAIDHQALSAASATGPAVTLQDLPYSTRPEG